MKDDQVKDRTSNKKGQVTEVLRRTDGDQSSKSKDKVQHVVEKMHPVYGDLKSDLQRLWVIF